MRVQDGGLGGFHEVVGDLHGRLSDFIHRVVVHRRDEAIRSWRVGFAKTLWSGLTGG